MSKKMISNSKEYESCVICTNNMYSSITCPKCNFKSCKKCVKKYLLTLKREFPQCMSCSEDWDLEFVASKTVEKFHNDVYRKHRTAISIEKEKALLPATQETARKYKIKVTLQKQKTMLDDKLKKLKKRYDERCSKIKRLQRGISNEIYSLELYGANTKEEEKKNIRFIGHCPVEECNGYVNSKYICGICNNKVCKKCCDTPHEGDCNQNMVDTIKLLRKDTKPCPSCSTPIYKISGCDQMFCQHEDTPIWLWSGEKKLAKHIMVGDKLIGDDGEKCEVLTVTSGENKLYEIHQRFGDNYKVIGGHLLSLEKDGKTIDISVEDYMKLSNRSRSRGYHRVGCKNINWPHTNILLDPYILGLWLGDGTTRGDGFSSGDIEIVQYWVEWGLKNNIEITHSRPFGYDIRNKYQGKILPVGYNDMKNCTGCKKKQSLCCASQDELLELMVKEPNNMLYQELYAWRSCLPTRKDTLILGKSRKRNFFKVMLEKYGLDNKFIPIIYLRNDRNIRLKLLAGIIDTDGNRTGKSYKVTQSIVRKKLCDDIVDLCHSLGLATTVKKSVGKNVTFPHEKIYMGTDNINVRIMGGTHEIPVILHHKKILEKNTYPISTIKVTECGRGNYVGFSISNHTKRYLLGDGTITHNCITCHTPFSWTTLKVETGVIHNPHYYELQRQLNSGIAPRNLLDVRCGGIPSIRELDEKLTRIFPGCNEHIDFIYKVHGLSAHVRGVVIGMYNEQRDNEDLRVKFLVGKISEKKWESELRKRNKKYEKSRDIHQILVTFCDVIDDTLRNILQMDDNILPCFDALNTIQEYTQKQLRIIENRYKNKVPIISDWSIITPGSSGYGNWSYKPVRNRNRNLFRRIWI